MNREKTQKEWRGLSEEVITGMTEWREQHSRATLREIEEEIDKRLSVMRARMISDAAMNSASTEWQAGEKAARGTEGDIYPWGNQPPAGNLLNFADVNLTVGENWPVDKNIDDGYKYTAPVGSYPRGASPYGALDMAGNVWEWVSDWFYPYPDNLTSDPDYGDKFKIIRGGSWNDVKYYVHTAFRRSGVVPSGPVDIIGFRCARTP